MSQQELPIVSALEFDQVRSSIKNYIKTKSDFTDYDFEGSNLSMLVDILSYNTLYTTYNVNMAANELNLDTAVLRDNIVSIAKRLGYKASSYTSSKVSINITVSNVSNYDSVVIEPGSILSAATAGKNYTFITRKRQEILTNGANTVTFSNIELVEGTEFAIAYSVDETNEHQRFFVPNNFIDAETIRVFVVSDPTNNLEVEYTRKETIVDVNNSDTVFFVEEVQDQKYEIVFGDDVIGRKVKNGEVVRIQYVITSGVEANGISNFTYIGQLKGVKVGQDDQNLARSDVSYTLSEDESIGGSAFETIQSIKYRAPRAYSAQERAVTISDYETIVKTIYPNAELISVIGGESLTPPQYGKVFITIKPFVGETVSSSEKIRIIKELRKYKVGSIETQMLDPVAMSLIIKPIVTYDPTLTTNREADLISLINAAIEKYGKGVDFNRFGGTYSDLELRCKIKDLDSAIQFVNLPLYLQQGLCFTAGVATKYELDFYTKLRKESDDKYFVLSNPFNVKGVSTAVYLGAESGCDSDGKLYLYTIGGTKIKAVGTIDFEKGKLEFTVTSLDNLCINIVVVPEIIDIVFGPNIVPALVIGTSTINDIVDDIGVRTNALDEDQSLIDTSDILSTTLTGDPDVTDGISLDDGPGGSTVVIPIITDDEATTAVDTDPPVFDPNDFATIDDYTPETNPYSCS